MSASPGKSRLILRFAVLLMVVGAIGIAVSYQFRDTATVAAVERGTAVDLVTGSVVVHADKDLQEIKSELGGRVVWIDPRQLGEPFAAGEPIVKLDATELERLKEQAARDFEAVVQRRKIQQQNDPALQAAKEALATAELQFNRRNISELQWKNAQRDFQQVETKLALEDYDAQQARVKFENQQAELQRQIDKMVIRAPIDGIVQSVLVGPGALIGPTTTVATFFSNARVVIAKVGEEDVGKVRVGQPARVRLLNLPGETFDGKVTAILPFAEEQTQRYSVYLDVNAEIPKLKPFSTGEATITVGERANQPLIPRRAIFNDDVVLVVKDGKVEKRTVKLGFKALNFAEVTGGLAEGEQVIIDNVDLYRDGQRVRTVTSP